MIALLLERWSGHKIERGCDDGQQNRRNEQRDGFIFPSPSFGVFGDQHSGQERHDDNVGYRNRYKARGRSEFGQVGKGGGKITVEQPGTERDRNGNRGKNDAKESVLENVSRRPPEVFDVHGVRPRGPGRKIRPERKVTKGSRSKQEGGGGESLAASHGRFQCGEHSWNHGEAIPNGKPEFVDSFWSRIGLRDQGVQQFGIGGRIGITRSKCSCKDDECDPNGPRNIVLRFEWSGLGIFLYYFHHTGWCLLLQERIPNIQCRRRYSLRKRGSSDRQRQRPRRRRSGLWRKAV
mmetsp:Transcript_4206/g.10148  ORF Transcript_4206/g.10148 Transcript_4206/m.10148 type:complete len:292 (+) Transcript_4206:365-1240(+)